MVAVTHTAPAPIDPDAMRTLYFTIGVDIGQRRDPTAVAVAEVCEHLLSASRHESEAVYRIRALDRLPLDTRYKVVADRVAEMVVNLKARLLAEGRPDRRIYVLADETGVGNPVVEMIRAALKEADALVPVTGVTLTAGANVKVGLGSRSGTVGKERLVQELTARIENGRVILPASSPHAAQVRRELEDFSRRPKREGSDHMALEARTGSHDDFVTALGLATLIDPIKRRPRIVPAPEGWL